MSDEKAIEMFIAGLVIDSSSQAPVVILKDETDSIHLPIWIGMAEATAIASAVKQINMGRPLTHDLLQTLFLQLGIRVERVMISDLKDSTYFAEIILSHGEKAIILDARPSDAIALAVRSQAPIYVAEKVLETARMAMQEEGKSKKATSENPDNTETKDVPDFNDIDKDKWKEILESLDEDDFKFKV